MLNEPNNNSLSSRWTQAGYNYYGIATKCPACYHKNLFLSVMHPIIY